MLLGLSVVAAVPIAWYFLRTDQPAVGKKPARSAQPRVSKPRKIKPGEAKKTARTDYKGASIQPADNCCQAVREISGTRFLVEEVPRLPLERCDRIAECLCKYNNYPDRRSGEDRRNVYGSLSTVGEIGRNEANHRSGMDRRSSIEAELENLDYDI